MIHLQLPFALIYIQDKGGLFHCHLILLAWTEVNLLCLSFQKGTLNEHQWKANFDVNTLEARENTYT